MKNTLIAAYLALFISFAAVYFLPKQGSMAVLNSPSPVPSPSPSLTAAPEPVNLSVVPAPSPTPSPTPELPDAPESLLVKCGDEICMADMQEYLKGVLAAEMPAYFEPEALKAQAVAARTYAMYCAEHSHHSDAQVCTDFACCQAWTDPALLEESWGESYGTYWAAISRAVEETEGEYLCYDSEPIFAAFHASSCGYTADCAQVWNPLPYLISVESPESADTVPDYISRQEVSSLDFRDTLLSDTPWADFTGPEEGWVQDIERDGGGRVISACIGGVNFSGTRLRELFSLRSTAFTLEYTEGLFLFTVTGHGHGVGMSQHGANLMAARGTGYREILAHYYPGTVLAG